jgi:hypothetical protein
LLQQNQKLPSKLRGWIFDVYPSIDGQMNVWLIVENGKRVKIIDSFKPRFYVSTRKGASTELHNLVSKLPIDSYRFITKFANATDCSESTVMEITVTNYKKISFLD